MKALMVGAPELDPLLLLLLELDDELEEELDELEEEEVLLEPPPPPPPQPEKKNMSGVRVRKTLVRRCIVVVESLLLRALPARNLPAHRCRVFTITS